VKNKISHNAKKLLVSLFVLIVLFPFIYTLVRFSIYQADKADPPIMDLSNYQNWSNDGWIYEEPYNIFPAALLPAQASRTVYLFKRVRSPFPLLYDDDVIIYLECDLDEEHFSAEYERLKELCGGSRNDFGDFEAYVYAVRGGGFFYEYALIEEELHRIVYISFQNREFAKQYVDYLLLPDN